MLWFLEEMQQCLQCGKNSPFLIARRVTAGKAVVSVTYEDASSYEVVVIICPHFYYSSSLFYMRYLCRYLISLRRRS